MVATPIGNLADISERALQLLAQVDIIAAEDTRVSRCLLRHYHINTTLISLREHNEYSATQRLLKYLASGQAVALISDAGTPTISDPGSRLVAQVHAAHYPVIPLPGACAALAALAAAGMPSEHFMFYGFPETKAIARRKQFAQLATLPYTLIFFEAPHRIMASLADMLAVFGEARVAAVARELTKKFETIRRGSLAEIYAWITASPEIQRGEWVIVIDAAPQEALDDAAIDRLLLPLLRVLPLKQAVKTAVEISGQSRNAFYRRALRLTA